MRSFPKRSVRFIAGETSIADVHRIWARIPPSFVRTHFARAISGEGRFSTVTLHSRLVGSGQKEYVQTLGRTFQFRLVAQEGFGSVCGGFQTSLEPGPLE